MRLRSLVQKPALYAAELQLCAALGSTASSRLRLAVETGRFHLLNRLAPRRGAGAPQRYQVQIGGRHQDLWLRPASGDFFVLHELFLGECYFIPQHWRNDVRTVVDLGANIGLSCLYFGRYFPQAHYICVEPEPGNVELLRRNTQGLGTSVQVLAAAVSDQAGEALFDDTRPSWGGQLRESPGPGRQVRCMTGDEILALTQTGTIDLLKIDIEGAEARLFRGPCTWLQHVGMLVIEIHAPYSLAQFECDMGRFGFSVTLPDPALGNRLIFAHNQRLTHNPQLAQSELTL